jgi:hypothetical protein
MDQPDIPEDPSSSKFLASITTFKDSLDLFISFKFRVEVTCKEPMLDTVAKDPMLDRAAYQDVKLDTCQSLLRSGICSNYEVFSQCLGSPQPLLLSSPPRSSQVSSLGATEWWDRFVSLLQHGGAELNPGNLLDRCKCLMALSPSNIY